jgi:arabinofuranosyltransferase
MKVDDLRRKSLALAIITAALFLARPDAIVLVAPSLIIYLWNQRHHARQYLPLVLLGILPAVTWILFSLFYYGAPVPNTALAKVQTGQTLYQNAAHALHYYAWTVQSDLITALLINVGILFAVIGRLPRIKPLGFGLLLWIVYLAYVGADYMGGRFFSGAVLVATAITALHLNYMPHKVAVWSIALILFAASPMLGFTVFSPASYEERAFSTGGVADERGYYYQSLGLLPSLQRGTWRSHPWVQEGDSLRTFPGWYSRCNIGMAAYAAGPSVRWVDPLALAEPLLARLPARSNSRVGHYERAIPEGYLDTLLYENNAVRDAKLLALSQDVSRAVRSPLWNPERFAAIWRLNTGYHAHAAVNFDREAIGLPGVPVKTHAKFTCFGLSAEEEGTWKLGGVPTKATRVIFPTLGKTTEAAP